MVTTGEFTPEIIFESSGTTGQTPARHFVKHLDIYRESFVKGFEFFYGNIEDYCILGLLPAYLERSGSSLVWMVDEWMRISKHPENGFYLYDFEKLRDVLLKLGKQETANPINRSQFCLIGFCRKIFHATFPYDCDGNRRYERTKGRNHQRGIASDAERETGGNAGFIQNMA